VKKLSDTSKGINAKVISHLAVGLRTMPLRYVMSISPLLYLLSDKKNYSWVRQFIDMSGLQVVTDLLTTLNKTKNRQVPSPKL
jgi:hypothetical protein